MSSPERWNGMSRALVKSLDDLYLMSPSESLIDLKSKKTLRPRVITYPLIYSLDTPSR